MSIKCQPRPQSPGRKTKATLDREAVEDVIRNTLNETEKFKLTMVLDSQHDFCEEERQNANEGGVLLEFYNVSGTNKILKYMLSTSPDLNKDILVDTYNRICCRAGTENPIANEEFAEYLTCANDGIPITANKKDITDNIADVTQILGHFGYTFQLTSTNANYKSSLNPVTKDGSDNIYLFCDAGPAIFKTLIEDCVPLPPADTVGTSAKAKVARETWEKLYSTNLVHTLTPATLCDSATITRCQAFFNPTIFMRPPIRVPMELETSKNNAYPSLSSLFGTTIYASSQEYNASGPNNMGLLYISGNKKYENNPLVMENKVTSVPKLGYNIIKSFHDDSSIPLKSQFEQKDLGEDGWNLATRNKLNIKDKSGKNRLEIDFEKDFTYRQAFDIKRAADSDQVYHTYLIVQYKRRNGDLNFKYIFCTGDRICAFIAFYYYGLNTMYMVKSNKTYKLWRERQPAYPELIRLHGYISQDGIINLPIGTIIPEAPASALGGSYKNKSNRLRQYGGVPIYIESLNAWYNKNTGNFINASQATESNNAIYEPTPEQLSEIREKYDAKGRQTQTIITDYGHHKMYQAFQIRKEAFINILRACKDKLQDYIFEKNPKLAILASFYNIKINSSNDIINTLLIDNHNNLYDCAKIKNGNVNDALSTFAATYGHIEKKQYEVDRNLDNVLLHIVNNATQHINYDATTPPNQGDDPLRYILKLINGDGYGRPNHSPNNVLRTLGVFGEIIDNSYNMESSLIFNYFFDDIYGKNTVFSFKRDFNTIMDTLLWSNYLYDRFNQMIVQLDASLNSASVKSGKTLFVYKRIGGRRTLKRKRRHNRKTRKSRK
jgi:hypothetical protein